MEPAVGLTEVSPRQRVCKGKLVGLTPFDRWQEEQAQNEARQQFLEQLGVFNQQYDVTIQRSGPRSRAASRADGAADSCAGVPP